MKELHCSDATSFESLQARLLRVLHYKNPLIQQLKRISTSAEGPPAGAFPASNSDVTAHPIEGTTSQSKEQTIASQVASGTLTSRAG